MPEKKKAGPKKFNSRGGSDDRKERGFRKVRKKICFFCVDKIDEIDFKNTEKLKKHISDKGKILPRRVSGNCAKHQRKVTEAIKIAREIALLPYTSD